MASPVKELDKLNPTQHMATRTGKMARDNPLCSGKKFFHTRNLLLTKLVRPRWWILASFFLFLRLCRLRPHLGIQTNKKVIIQYPAILTLVNNLGISTIMHWWLHCSLHGIYTTSLIIASGLTLWVALLIKQLLLQIYTVSLVASPVVLKIVFFELNCFVWNHLIDRCPTSQHPMPVWYGESYRVWQTICKGDLGGTRSHRQLRRALEA